MTTPFVLTTDSSGHGSISVDGHDVSERVIALELAVVPGKSANLVLHVSGGGEFAGEGVVTVMRDPTEQEMRERLADWLTELDPAALDAAVRPRLTSMRDSYAARVLEVLGESARG